MSDRRRLPSARGQSEVLGFLLVFALVLTTMSVITVAGLDGLRDVRDAERVNNAERAFDVFAENVDDLVEQGLTSQATEINLANAELYFGNGTTVTVEGAKVGVPSENFSYSFAVRPFVYETATGDRLVYEAGAVVRQDRSGSVVLDGPPATLSPDRSNVVVVQTRQTGRPVGVGGSTTVLVRTERAATDLYRVNTTAYDLTITVDSPRAAAWGRHLEERPGVSCGSPAGGSVSCSLTTDRLYLTVVRVDVGLK